VDLLLPVALAAGMAAPTQFAINRSDLPLIENAPTHDESPDVFVRLSQDLVVALPRRLCLSRQASRS
jgi:hypothetical protein